MVNEVVSTVVVFVLLVGDVKVAAAVELGELVGAVVVFK